MKIRKIKINNFRGIKQLEWGLPDGKIFCLIGRGDSTKSTILEAIKCIFNPQWNLPFSDSDFHGCNTENPIEVEITIGELIAEFFADNKYASHLRGWNKKTLALSDEPDDNLENVLTARLLVAKDLEPKWTIVCDRNSDGIPFKSIDRSKVGIGLIGSFSEKQFTWAAGTALAKLTEWDNLNESLLNATRAAKSSLDQQRQTTLKNFDAAALKSEEVAKLLGVPVDSSYKAHLDLGAINIKIGGLTLHDGDMPLRQLGLGSRRMLLCGIQEASLVEQNITLFDEVELGLEPHRIARLIKHVKDDDAGQYFLTTHSPVVLRELTVGEIYVVHKNSGNVRITAASITTNAQGNIRSSADAFLSTKVIVCEGATEVGFLRGLDDFWLRSGKTPFSYQGVALLDANGAGKIKDLANAFITLAYVVAVVADGDAPAHFSPQDSAALTSCGVEVIVWPDNLALEQRAMLDLPWTSVLASVNLAQELGHSVHDNVRSKLNIALDPSIDKWTDSLALRKAIGDAAKSGKAPWFKSVTNGQRWFEVISPAFTDSNFLKSELALKLDSLRSWVDHE